MWGAHHRESHSAVRCVTRSPNSSTSAALDSYQKGRSQPAASKKKAPSSFLPDIQQQIHTRSRGRFFGRRWLLFGRIPFEMISLVMIVVMLVYYILTLQSAPTTVTPTP